MIDAALPHFLGAIQQRPPNHSAVKIAGRRAYKLARKGKAIEIALRTVTVHRLEVRRYDYPELELEIECGSGTYVRSLGRDLASAIGTAAVMSALERTSIGGFHVEDAVAPDGLTAESLAQYLQPALAAVVDLPHISLSEAQLIEVRHGRPIPAPQAETRSASIIATEWAAVDRVGKLTAILFEKRPGQLWPACNFQA